MKMHHIGFVCRENDINKFFFFSKENLFILTKFKNKIIIGLNNRDSLWYEFA